MKKMYVLLAAICLIVCAIIGISSPNASHEFIIKGYAMQSENSGKEQIGILSHEENVSALEETTEKIDHKISQEITKQTETQGAGKSFKLETLQMSENIVKNQGFEDEYKEEIPEEPQEEKIVEQKTETEKNQTNSPVKYKKIANSNVIESFDTSAGNVSYLGEFKLTAYCPCTKCCGKWGANRPVDENGYTIVGTASGARAYANHTIAVDPSVIPYGTTVVIERDGVFYEYTAEDCGGAIKNKRIDVYFDSHSTACDFGVRYGNVYIIK